jgi:hypothetical protein
VALNRISNVQGELALFNLFEKVHLASMPAGVHL